MEEEEEQEKDALFLLHGGRFVHICVEKRDSTMMAKIKAGSTAALIRGDGEIHRVGSPWKTFPRYNALTSPFL